MSKELTLTSWTNNELLKYTQIFAQEGYGKGSFGVRIFATLKYDSSLYTGISGINQAYDIIEATIRAEDERMNPEVQAAKVVERQELLNLFPDVFQVQELPNGYCAKWCCTQKPWYRVLTKIGWITIGWRKSVINIDWSETVVEQSGDDLFPNAIFTVGSGYHSAANNARFCHAHGLQNAVMQIATILVAEHKKPVTKPKV